ncbi:MAG: hypothetical protein RMN25_06100 [Anaerolineae bacterium]|nr:hypothetical protein [Thermoflexales bacterium]MDW8407339.1 hypothetical protein [Anaerolineae bacterium]
MKRMCKAIVLSVAMVIVVLTTASCGAVDSLLGGSSAGTVSTLWADVPPFDGATKADLQLPAASRIFIQAAFQGKLEFIAYTTTKAPQEVQRFYSRERMQAAGWNSDAGGCADAGMTGAANAAFCLFGKRQGNRDEGLVIVIAQDDQKQQTQIFYVRVDITATPTPQP